MKCPHFWSVHYEGFHCNGIIECQKEPKYNSLMFGGCKVGVWVPDSRHWGVYMILSAVGITGTVGT